MCARIPAALALLWLLAGPAGAQAPPAGQPEKAFGAALRSWGRSIGVLGYVYGAPLLEWSIAEYRQTQGLAQNARAPRGLIAHLGGGRLPDHETRELRAPDPDVLVSSAWLDVEPQPYVLWVPPMEGHWYSVHFMDSFLNDAGYVSTRTSGGVGGWYLIADAAWEGERPPGVLEEIRIRTPVTWALFRIAATKRDEAAVHERYQSKFKFLPLDVYQRSPKAAAYASPIPQIHAPARVRAVDEMRGTLDAFRVINLQLRQIAPPAGEEGLLALFDRAGFGPRVEFEPAKLPKPLADGLRDAAREGQRVLEGLRYQPQTTKNGWSSAPPSVAAFGDDYLRRAVSAVVGIGADLPAEVLCPTATADRDGRPLDGRHDYTIRFAPGGFPPAKAFWTIAAYDGATRRLLDTKTNRHSVGSRTEELAYGSDGSLELFVSSDEPEDPARRANWLPVRTAPFLLIARIYQPEPAALDGSYAMPPVMRVEE